MMNTLKISIITSFFVLSYLFSFTQNSLHDFTTYTIEGEEFKLSDLKGKKVLLVNTASKCGFTGQYEDLQVLYERYQDRDFIIIGFPANNFLNQEPGTNEEILTFCQQNYGVTFPLMAKTSVRGRDIDPIFDWLTSKEKNGVSGSSVSWNFQKFLIDENGQLVSVLSPRTSPLDEQIISWIEGLEVD